MWGVIFFIGAILYIGYLNTSIRALKKRVKVLEQDRENEKHTEVDHFE
ncbi:hypothetical protein F3D3_0032 [Fusibacter sp. 3D3]|nr:hypothetical protein F3D3_0032 [Fusibacter sp. 3D3]